MFFSYVQDNAIQNWIISCDMSTFTLMAVGLKCKTIHKMYRQNYAHSADISSAENVANTKYGYCMPLQTV